MAHDWRSRRAARDGLIRLYVRSLDAATAQVIPDTVGAAAPFWSPDGNFVGFFAGGRLMKVASTGGPAFPLCQAAGAAFGAHWSENNQILFSSGQPNVAPIRRVSAAGGASSVVLTPNTEAGELQYWWPSLLPDGDHIVYFALGPGSRPIGIYVASLKSQERKLLVPGGSNVTFTNGFLIYLRDQTLVAHALDMNRLELVGEPTPIGDQVLVGGAAAATGAFTVSQTGVLAYQTGPVLRQSQLVWIDRRGTEGPTVGEEADYGNLRVSPDGTRVSVSLGDPTRGTSDIWLLDLATGRRSRFTFDEGNEVHSVWSPDGQRLVFNSNREGVLNLYEKASNGAGSERLLLADREDKMPESWSPDGRHLLYRIRGNAQQGAGLWMLPLEGSGTPTPVLQTKADETSGRFSPDGRWIAYISNESGPPHLYIAPFPAGGGKWQVSSAALPAGGAGFEGHPSWRADGKEVFYLSGNQLIAAEVTIQKDAIRVGDVRPLFRANFRPARGNPYVASADGQRFLVNRFRDQTTGAPITLVVNWPAGLKR